MSMPNNPQYGAAMSPTQSQNGRAVTPIRDGSEVGTEEPQLSRAPSAHHEQPLPFDLMQPGLGWDVLSAGRPMTGAQVYGTSAYNTQGGAYMGQYPDIPTDTGPYAVQHAYPPPTMPYGNWQPQALFGTHAGTDAGQASHPQMHCQPGTSPSTPQDHHDVFSPNQSAMAASGFGANNMGHLDFTDPPSGPSTSSQDPTEPNTNPNGWTQDQEDLVRHGKHEGKKVKQIGAELKRRFGVERSDDNISKRWKIIKSRYSKVESKAVIQNVMPFLLQQVQLLNTKLGAVQNHHDPDPQVTGVMDMHEMQEHFQKGLTKLVEEWVFRGQDQSQAPAPAQARGQVRHRGANL